MFIPKSVFRNVLNTTHFTTPYKIIKSYSTISRNGCPPFNPRYRKDIYKDHEIKYYPQNFLDKLLNRRRVRKKPARECCRFCRCRMNPYMRKIPDAILEIAKQKPGSCVYPTFGTSYIVEVPKNLKQAPQKEPTRSEKLISKIEEKKNAKVEDVYNPMPKVEDSSIRTLELYARKLHPLYQKYEYPRRKKSKFVDYSKNDIEEKKIRHPMELFKGKMSFYPQKKVFIDYKMSELPRYLTSKLRDHEYSGMDIRINKTKECCEKGQYHFTVCPSPVCKLLKKIKMKK